MRNMIDTNIKAFDSIAEQLHVRYDIEVVKAKRYLRTSSIDKDILKNTELKNVITLLPSLTFIDASYSNRRYLIIIGYDLRHSDIDNVHYDYVPSNSGIFTILLSEKLLLISQNVAGDIFVEEIMHQHLDEKYSGHDYEDLVKYFQPISILALKKESILYDRDLFQIAVNVISDNNPISVLNFEQDVLNKYNHLSLSRELNTPFELILNSILTSKFKFCFLELYRIIERLFPITYLLEFHSISKSTISFPEFVSELESITSWKPKEDEALKKILESDNTGKNSFITELTKRKGFGDNLYKYIYKLRNSIVHFRMLHQEIEHNEDEWNDLIFGLLEVIEQQYFKFKNHV